MIHFYEDDYFFEKPEPKFQTEVVLLDCDTLSAAARYTNPCCLNFASHKRPGGGYEVVKDLPMPIRTQEEDLFRRSNLPELMDVQGVRKWYPLDGVEGIYTDGITVVKDEYLKPCTPFDIALITVPAVVNPVTIEKQQMAADRAKRIFEIAAHNKVETLILGAWGCGVFANDPHVVVSQFKDLIKKDYAGIFKVIVFAIPDRNSHNYNTFKEELKDFLKT